MMATVIVRRLDLSTRTYEVCWPQGYNVSKREYRLRLGQRWEDQESAILANIMQEVGTQDLAELEVVHAVGDGVGQSSRHVGRLAFG